MSSTRPATHDEIRRSWDEHWGGMVVTPERIYRPNDVTGLWLLADGREVAFVSWAVDEASNVGEVVTLDAFEEQRGHGRAALTAAEAALRAAGAREAKLFTTNPNVRAITLYLRAGWRLMAVHVDAMDRVRALKPDVPLVELGLPLRDMLEFQKRLIL